MYDQSKFLNAADRLILCKCLIKCYLFEDHNRKYKPSLQLRPVHKIILFSQIPKSRFQSYYVKNKKKRAQGKLYDQFQHNRALLIKAGLASKRVRRQVTLGNDSERRGDDSDRISDVESINSDSQDTATLLTYLEAHAGPWPDIVAAWNRSNAEILDLLKTVTTEEYFSRYPALLTNQGLELVSSTKAKFKKKISMFL